MQGLSLMRMVILSVEIKPNTSTTVKDRMCLFWFLSLTGFLETLATFRKAACMSKRILWDEHGDRPIGINTWFPTVDSSRGQIRTKLRLGLVIPNAIHKVVLRLPDSPPRLVSVYLGLTIKAEGHSAEHDARLPWTSESWGVASTQITYREGPRQPAATSDLTDPQLGPGRGSICAAVCGVQIQTTSPCVMTVMPHETAHVRVRSAGSSRIGQRPRHNLIHVF
ncbi:hypothetical protein WOLCODRAFT_158103 [Wolfiporia cocos MD-104 SS10]|uniref:Uncharacterized protein n=1 Tax=Wolfiporia cocos (strain MD-104) TaxID=742152 RepID=A0A2H3J6W0_WOLCO|nr:hypothetical protein WOLCODRAFT_158103 [Wolfiporia cocos MD-104 SS10]